MSTAVHGSSSRVRTPGRGNGGADRVTVRIGSRICILAGLVLMLASGTSAMGAGWNAADLALWGGFVALVTGVCRG